MNKTNVMTILLLCCVVILTGCQQSQRTDPPIDPVIREPVPAMPENDVPPVKQPPGNDYIETSVKAKFRPAVPDEDKASLLYHARLDLLRIMICSDETSQVDGETYESDQCLQVVSEHFTDLGFRVIEGGGCPAYGSPASQLADIADRRDVDMFVMLKVNAKKVDKFGDFYSYEAKGRAKVAQISDSELLTTKSAFVRGKRALNEDQAADSALAKCGQELAEKLSDEILRKSGRGVLLRRVVVDGLDKAVKVDYVRVGLSNKPGIKSVVRKSWDSRTGRAVFWVRLDASVKENLGAYLEQIKTVKLKVERLDKTTVHSSEKGLLE